MRRLLGVAALALVCAACGGSTHAAKQHKVAGEPGYWVKVHGHRMYYECEGKGSPTILLEAGLGGDHRAWSAVAPELAKTTRTCSYDRAGLGFSAAAGENRTGRDQLADLQALLVAAGIQPPYVLVGHSYGGILAHEYASAHPKDLEGVVLVDSSHPLQARRFLAALGPPRRGESPIRNELRAFLRAPPNAENVDMAASASEARSAGKLGHVPLVVITAGRENSPALGLTLKRLLDRTWISLQDDLARLSTNSIHVIADLSHHNVMSADNQPELVVTAIRAVVASARSGERLSPCKTLFAGSDATCVSG